MKSVDSDLYTFVLSRERSDRAHAVVDRIKEFAYVLCRSLCISVDILYWCNNPKELESRCLDLAR